MRREMTVTCKHRGNTLRVTLAEKNARVALRKARARFAELNYSAAFNGEYLVSIGRKL